MRRLPPALYRGLAGVRAGACALLLGLAAPAFTAQTLVVAGGAPSPGQPAAKAPAQKVAQASPQPQTRPAWSELNPEQQQALRPLSGSWGTISEAQKRKWIALSRNFRSMAPEEQAKLHSRMSEWVALSPQQRAQARLNFGETKNLSADDKKAKWEAYQALSPEEKRKLADGANRKTPPTAAAVKPVPPQKLATVPRSDNQSRPPRIAAGAASDTHAVPLSPAGPN